MQHSCERELSIPAQQVFSRDFHNILSNMIQSNVKKWLKYVLYGTQINRLCQKTSWKIAGKKFIQLLKSEENFCRNSDSCNFSLEQFA